MRNIDIIVMAFRNLVKRKLRAFLTILGVVIGACSIIIMLSLGLGFSRSFEEQIANWGDIQMVTINSTGLYGGDINEDMILDDKFISAAKELGGVEAVIPVYEIYISATSGKYENWISIVGVDPENYSYLGIEVAEGETILDSDRMGVLYGSEVPYQFYNPYSTDYYWSDASDPERKPPSVDVLNDRILFKLTSYSDKEPKPYRIQSKGILLPKNYDTDYYAFMTLEDVRDMKLDEKIAIGEKRPKIREYDRIKIKCIDIESAKAISAFYRDAGYDVYSQVESMDQVQSMQRIVQVFLGGIGSVAFLVATIGITNTMIMAIYERTKEIGVMKVIGATISDIKKLFLVEAALIGFIGGVIAIGISIGLSKVINYFAASYLESMGMGSVISVIPLWLCLLSLGFSTVIGVVAGYFPAKRATKLSPLIAIRN